MIEYKELKMFTFNTDGFGDFRRRKKTRKKKQKPKKHKQTKWKHPVSGNTLFVYRKNIVRS